MKPILCLGSLLCAALLAGCVVAPEISAQPAVPVAMAPAGPLDQLVAPVALYPDALLALVLPAATASSDIVLAARYLNSGGDPAQVEAQPWDDSVKGLAHYPDVVKWMDENLAWTQQIGDAYLSNPSEVMAAVQRVRAQARANGLLVDTPQQQVIIDGSYIRIIPAQADVIYVPRYDPEIIYVERPVYYASDPWLTFGVGFGVGWWLNYDCDWGHRVIVVNPHRGSHWQGRRDWRQPQYGEHDWHPWRPAPGRPRPPHRDFDARRDVRPVPPHGAPRVDHGQDGRPNGQRRHDQPNRVGQPNRPDRPDHLDQKPGPRDGRPDHANAPARSVPDTRQTRPATPNRPVQHPRPPVPKDQEEPGAHNRPAVRPPSNTQPQPPPTVQPTPAVVQPQPQPRPTPRQKRDDPPMAPSTAQRHADRPATAPGSRSDRPTAPRPAPAVQQPTPVIQPPAASREVRPPVPQQSRPPEVRQTRSAPATPPPVRRDPANDNQDNSRNSREREER